MKNNVILKRKLVYATIFYVRVAAAAKKQSG